MASGEDVFMHVPPVHLRKKAALVLLAAAILKKKRSRKRWENRLLWRSSFLARNPVLGTYHTTIKELRIEDADSFRNFLRLEIREFDELLQLVQPSLQKKNTNMRSSISPGEKLALTLRFLATGETYKSLHYGFRIGTSTISTFVPEVCDAIYTSLRDKYLQVPSSEHEWEEIAKGFQEKWQFPNCLGALDGKHILIQAPKQSGSFYYNYKGCFSIVLLALVDADYKFTYIDVGCNGRISDGGVLRDSSLQHALDEGCLSLPPAKPLPERSTDVPYVIVGDEAFPLKEHLLKPFPAKSLDDGKRIFNYRLSRARRVSENAFGILVHRFQIFQKCIALEPDKVEKIVLAAITLHNFLREKKSNKGIAGISDMESEVQELAPGELLPSISQQGSNRSSTQARAIRDEFEDYFLTNGEIPWQWNKI